MEEERIKQITSEIDDCTKLREEIYQAVLKNGGHLSSNLGVIELTYSLVKKFDPFSNDYLFDVGHQTYAFKLLTGRKLDTLREINGVAPFSSRKESKADRYDNGHSGDSISTAIGMAISKKLKGDESYTICIIGDSSLNNGLALEALSVLGRRKDLTRFILVVNTNSMAIKENDDRRSLLMKRFKEKKMSELSSLDYSKVDENKYVNDSIMESLEFSKTAHTFEHYNELGLNYMGPYNGHDLLLLDHVLEDAKKKSEEGPLVLEILTVKGHGLKAAEDDHLGYYHGVKADLLSEKKTTFSTLKEELLNQILSKSKKSYLITPAMETNSCLNSLFNKYPDCTLDVGIGEEDAIAIASGLALKGYFPYIDIYSTFLQRGIDETIENISRQRLSVCYLLERASLVGEDGESHHGIYDVSLLRGIPNKRVYQPFDETSLEYLLLNKAEEKETAVFIRLSKEEEIEKSSVSITLPLTYIKKEDNDTLVLAVGPLGYQLLKELEIKADKAMLVEILSSDLSCLLKYKNIYFYDPYSIEKGTCSHLKEFLFDYRYKGEFNYLTLKNEFVTFGKNKDLYDSLGMSVKDAIKYLKNLPQKE